MGAIAEIDMLKILLGRIIIVEAILIGLDPVVLLRIQMNTLDTAHNALTAEPTGWIAIHALSHRIVERVIHTLLQPKTSAIPFLYFINTVITKGRCIIAIREKGPYTIAIVAVQTISCTQPDIAPRIAKNTVYSRI